MPKRILLTGASGFVGPLLGRAILEHFPDVELIAAGGKSPGAIVGAKNVYSLLDSDAAAERLADYQPDIVLHLGGLSSVAMVAVDAAQIMDANLGGTLRLARALRKQSKDFVFVFASSGEVYGESFLSGEVDEATPLKPKNAYSRSKAAAEMALVDMLADRGRVVSLRLFNHTGPGQDERFVVPTFAAQIARIESGLRLGPLQVGNLSAERDFLDVRDVIDAYVKVVAYIGKLPKGAQVFNVCSSESRTIQSLLDQLLDMSRVPIEIAVDPARLRPSDIPRAASSSARFRSTFGWAPQFPVEETLRTVLDSWRERVALERPAPSI